MRHSASCRITSALEPERVNSVVHNPGNAGPLRPGPVMLETVTGPGSYFGGTTDYPAHQRAHDGGKGSEACP
jgi:hypothetical protein